MSGENRHQRGVVDQKDALSLYFEALLREEVQAQQQSRPHAEPEPVTMPVVLPPLISVPAIPEVELEVELEVETKGRVEPRPEAPVVVEPAVEMAVELATEAAAPPLPAGVPPWAAAPFQALLFKVSGLTLAVPLSELSGVQEWEQGAVTPMLGKIEWYLGLMGYRGRQVPVVDTAQLVLPPDRLASLTGEERGRLGHVVFIQDGSWGLACDSVEDVISLKHDEVKWRSSRSKRRWLAGTVLQQMCAIIDPPAFAEMLRTGLADEPEEP